MSNTITKLSAGPLAIITLLLFLAGGAAIFDGSGFPPPVCGGENTVAALKWKNPKLYYRLYREASQVANSEAVLWKIEAPNRTPSYLFGTMHVTDPRITTLPKTVRRALHASRILALETAEQSLGGDDREIDVRQYFELSQGKLLTDFLSEKEFSFLRNLLHDHGVPEEQHTILKPWFIAMMLGVFDPECEAQRQAYGLPTLDQRLEDIAYERGLEVVGLETELEHLSIPASLSLPTQIAMLKMSLNSSVDPRDMLETGIQLYLERKISLLDLKTYFAEENGTSGSESTRIHQEYLDKVIVERNLIMRNRSRLLLDRGNAFIAVGVGHLPGNNGLVALLRDDGYTVTAIE